MTPPVRPGNRTRGGLDRIRIAALLLGRAHLGGLAHAVALPVVLLARHDETSGGANPISRAYRGRRPSRAITIKSSSTMSASSSESTL
jgi:hypothetical protein